MPYSKRTKAIKTIEKARRSHVLWAEYQQNNPDWKHQTRSTAVGGPAHHLRWVKYYDEVLEVLRGE